MAGILYLVATPIGNLGDMPQRALDALASADVVCAEDTRVTGKLLAAFGIGKRLERLDEALIGSRADGIVARGHRVLQRRRHAGRVRPGPAPGARMP